MSGPRRVLASPSVAEVVVFHLFRAQLNNFSARAVRRRGALGRPVATGGTPLHGPGRQHPDPVTTRPPVVGTSVRVRLPAQEFSLQEGFERHCGSEHVPHVGAEDPCYSTQQRPRRTPRWATTGAPVMGARVIQTPIQTRPGTVLNGDSRRTGTNRNSASDLRFCSFRLILERA